MLLQVLGSDALQKIQIQTRISRKAVPRGLRKKLLFVNGAVVGTIEYGPAESCDYPSSGEHVIVMNCVWVLRRAKMRGFG